jgi:hypothetical protein
VSAAAILEAARLLEAQYGPDAAIVAIMRAAEYAALGDLEASDHWQSVAAHLDDPPTTLN